MDCLGVAMIVQLQTVVFGGTHSLLLVCWLPSEEEAGPAG